MGADGEDSDLISNIRILDQGVVMSFQPIARFAETTRQGHIHLEPNTIHLWGIKLDGSSHCLARCWEWLDERERGRAARRVREGDREQFVFAHGGLRAVLSRYLDIVPDLLGFDQDKSGKPMLAKELSAPSAITFNLSHAHGRALVAVSRAQAVGVDLERVREDIQVEDLSKRFFTPREHAAIMQSVPDQRAAIFFRYWVAKEALLKAQGIGLGGLSDCEIFLEADGVDTDIRARLGAHSTDQLRVRLLSCEKGWHAALAAQNLDRVMGHSSYLESETP